MQSADIRQSFIDFFTSRGHHHVPSASLVPAGDPTLLFTNAGMVQFKRVFQGLERRDYDRAVTVQKCVRAGGKHNDLEQVGRTARHHTFFEMLGNFSFGDYFKKEAIEYAWEWVTAEQWLGISPDRIYVTVHHTDDEARTLWRQVTGIADERIYGLGDKDNFWQMGDTGPCGPCSEIYVDLRRNDGTTERRNDRPTLVQSFSRSVVPTLSEFVQLAEGGELLEIWNLVFMQFDQDAGENRSPLPAPSVDTGAGLERIAAVMQGVESNFDTDLFMEIIRVGEDLIGKPYDRGPDGVGFRVLADHARAVSFLLADGVFPSSDGRGYVLRRILRRAVRHAYVLGRAEPTLAELSKVVVARMSEAYPELRRRADHITSVIRAEEQRFLETIEGGLERLDELMAGSAGTISGGEAFKLYDTYGFPLDLTELIAAERRWKVDTEGFERELGEQQKRSREARMDRRTEGPTVRREGGAGKWVRVVPRKRQKWIGYDTTEADTEILAFREADDRLELLLHENPFYAESGGQVSDTGIVKGAGWELQVDQVDKVDGKQIVVGSKPDDWEPTEVRAAVDAERRRNVERNHTATHLVHAALRNVLGEHVRQAGSVVAPDRLRFDFSHHAPVTDDELERIEAQVNEAVWENPELSTYELPFDEALKLGAMALFGEKYGDVVRVVDIPGVSKELCGGTHVRTTGQIGLFHFTHETGVAAGVRRIEAVTGPKAYDLVKTLDERIDEAAETLRTSPEHVARRIEQLLEEKRGLERQVQDLLRSGGGELGVGSSTFEVGDAKLVVGDSPVSDRDQIGLLMDSFRQQNERAIQVLFVMDDKAGIHVAVTDDLIQRGVTAGDLVNRIAAVSGGRGGGRPHFASAGAGDASKLSEARHKTPEIVASALDATVR